ncbi:MAG: aminotransferase class IV [Syntrophobacteraceae bacterium]
MNQKSEIVWMNGSFLHAEEVRLSPFDRGFLYGDGVFETIRAQRGAALYLSEHLERMRGALAGLRIDVPRLTNLFTETACRELLKRNGLADAIAVVKIIVSRGVVQGMGLPRSDRPTIVVSARAYAPPNDEVYAAGWTLHVFREGFAPPLARYKSLNYLYYCMARQDALDAGADEALLLDPRGNITETSAGSLLFRTGGEWWTPDSPHQLPGTTLARVAGIIRGSDGLNAERRIATLESIESVDVAWVLNSLMGVMPVRRIGDRILDDLEERLAVRIREILFETNGVAMPT